MKELIDEKTEIEGISFNNYCHVSQGGSYTFCGIPLDDAIVHEPMNYPGGGYCRCGNAICPKCLKGDHK